MSNLLDILVEHRVLDHHTHVRNPQKINEKLKKCWKSKFSNKMAPFLNEKKIQKEMKDNILFASFIGVGGAGLLGALFFLPLIFPVYIVSAWFGSVGLIGACIIFYGVLSGALRNFEQRKQIAQKLYKEQFHLLGVDQLQEVKAKKWLHKDSNKKLLKMVKKSIKKHDTVAIEHDTTSHALQIQKNAKQGGHHGCEI